MRSRLLFTLSFGCAGTLASPCKPGHIAATPTSDATSSLLADATTSIVPTSDIITMSALPTTSEASTTSSELTTSIIKSLSTDSITTLETDFATSSFAFSATLETTTTLPTTTSAVEPFRFKLMGETGVLARTEMRAAAAAPYAWTIGLFRHDKPTILTMEVETGHLLFEGQKLCVETDLAPQNWWVAVKNCPETMLPQHQYVVCDPVHVDGDELRCSVPHQLCTRGDGPGFSCEHTGVQWTQFYARIVFSSFYTVGFFNSAALTSPSDLLHALKFVVKEV
ncbi:unnamed protein product [Fusarium venenatum]|uniref:Ubiquitin 3 binding protein But2 C-terminal domain-containing protein n=1 Tax=Fusarium venenatum TaxID=56646 RepID=A0A2L2TV02_9HYPO|nr:uncharacterized protein FVRRES_10548 [Fusarium venenatum]KAH6967149.1 hypothetical protein EDB82DRAFT_580640 [Fusarium venenatum]CEI70471.1 unnamed protein product [Fusarium venenatum]